MTLVETVADVGLSRRPGNLAFLTQTTLSVDDTAEIVAALKAASLDPVAAQRGHLLRHLEPPGGGQGDRPRMRRMLVIGAPTAAIRSAWPRSPSAMGVRRA
jgi:4-hydroxy-3-methylbut-2-enyl diphosphate reductase